MRIAWATDLHMNHFDENGRKETIKRLSEYNADLLVISGDTAESETLIGTLGQIKKGVKVPIYFVLGNHDFYGSAIGKVRREVSDFCRHTEGIKWLHEQKHPIRLTEKSCLIGCDGWGDGALGDFEHTPVRLNDFIHISELYCLDKKNLRRELVKQGKDSALRIQWTLEEAVMQYENILMVTHIPPFAEATWHMGAHSNEFFLPFYSCGAVGAMLDEIMSKNPEKKLTVLCGHSHGNGEYVRGNIRVLTGAANYGVFVKQETIKIL